MPKILREHEKTRFRKYLDTNGISVDQLAHAAQIPSATLYQVVMGYHANPSLDRIQLILKTLNCKFEDIFEIDN